MSTFVLVHGAWLGGWSWRDVATRLSGEGHLVFTPTLTGMGERSHLAGPDVDLDTHIADLLAVIEYERLDDFALVAHSYGGMVATAVADRIPELVRSLVYFDAALPKNGEAMLDFVSAERKQLNIRLAGQDGGGFQVPGGPMLLETGIEDGARREAFISRVGFQPLPALLQPISLTGAFNRIANKAYVFAARNNSPRFRGYMEWARAEPGWSGIAIDTHHFPMATDPGETARIIAQVHAGEMAHGSAG